MKNKIFIYLTIILSIIVVLLVSYIVYDKFLSEEEITRDVLVSSPKKVVINDLDIIKCLNASENVTYSNPEVVTNAYGLNPKINDDKLGVTVNVEGGEVFSKNITSITSVERDGSDFKIYVDGFNRNISKVFIGEFGQDATGICLIYLFEDQTVGYTRLFKKDYDENNNVTFSLNYREIKGNDYIYNLDGEYTEIKDIVNIYNADYSIPNGGGASTIIASLKDGSFYDLSKFMQF